MTILDHKLISEKGFKLTIKVNVYFSKKIISKEMLKFKKRDITEYTKVVHSQGLKFLLTEHLNELNETQKASYYMHHASLIWHCVNCKSN